MQWPQINRKTFYLVSLVILIFLIYRAPYAPVNVDEFPHNNQAKEVVNWYLSLGTNKECLKDSPDNLRYYGQSVDNLAALINNTFGIQEEFATRHYLGAVVGWLLLLFTGWLSYHFTGSYFMAIVSILLLFISPRPFGQVLGNLKDLPFALGYVWASFGLIKFIEQLPKPSFRASFLLASGIAFSISVRIGGIIFFPMIGLFVLLWFSLNYKEVYKKNLLKDLTLHTLKTILILVLLGYFAGLFFWPYGLQNPILNPLKSLSLMQHYSISIRQIFESNFDWSTHLPWYYILKWLMISIPEIVLLSFIIFVVVSVIISRRKTFLIGSHLSYLVLLFSAFFPIVYVILINANLYSGWRQLYFFYPLLVVLATIGIYKLWNIQKQPVFRSVFALLLVSLSILPINHTFKTYPTEYVYFNTLAGSNKKAWTNYEYDYYFHGMKEASEWLLNNVELENESTIVSNFNITPYFPVNKKLNYKYVHFYHHYKTKWDYAILSNNYVHPYQLKNNTWVPEEPLKTFYHKGNPYIIILKWDGDDLLGALKGFRQKEYLRAIPGFITAIERKPNNIHLMAYLGECFLRLKDYTSLQNILEEGLSINPFYEPFLYLQALASYNQEKYQEALSLTLDLLKINSKYKKAFPLLANCYEKTGAADKANKIRSKIE